MKLGVLVGTPEEVDSAVSFDGLENNISSYRTHVAEILENAKKEGKTQIRVRSITMEGSPSDNFTRIMWIEQAIKEHQDTNALPEIVYIICRDADEAKLYKVVYNFYHAESKANRLTEEEDE